MIKRPHRDALGCIIWACVARRRIHNKRTQTKVPLGRHSKGPGDDCTSLSSQSSTGVVAPTYTTSSYSSYASTFTVSITAECGHSEDKTKDIIHDNNSKCHHMYSSNQFSRRRISSSYSGVMPHSMCVHRHVSVPSPLQLNIVRNHGDKSSSMLMIPGGNRRWLSTTGPHRDGAAQLSYFQLKREEEACIDSEEAQWNREGWGQSSPVSLSAASTEANSRSSFYRSESTAEVGRSSTVRRDQSRFSSQNQQQQQQQQQKQSHPRLSSSDLDEESPSYHRRASPEHIWELIQHHMLTSKDVLFALCYYEKHYAEIATQQTRARYQRQQSRQRQEHDGFAYSANRFIQVSPRSPQPQTKRRSQLHQDDAPFQSSSAPSAHLLTTSTSESRASSSSLSFSQPQPSPPFFSLPSPISWCFLTLKKAFPKGIPAYIWDKECTDVAIRTLLQLHGYPSEQQHQQQSLAVNIWKELIAQRRWECLSIESTALMHESLQRRQWSLHLLWSNLYKENYRNDLFEIAQKSFAKKDEEKKSKSFASTSIHQKRNTQKLARFNSTGNEGLLLARRDEIGSSPKSFPSASHPSSSREAALHKLNFNLERALSSTGQERNAAQLIQLIVSQGWLPRLTHVEQYYANCDASLKRSRLQDEFHNTHKKQKQQKENLSSVLIKDFRDESKTLIACICSSEAHLQPSDASAPTTRDSRNNSSEAEVNNNNNDNDNDKKKMRKKYTKDHSFYIDDGEHWNKDNNMTLSNEKRNTGADTSIGDRQDISVLHQEDSLAEKEFSHRRALLQLTMQFLAKHGMWHEAIEFMEIIESSPFSSLVHDDKIVGAALIALRNHNHNRHNYNVHHTTARACSSMASPTSLKKHTDARSPPWHSDGITERRGSGKDDNAKLIRTGTGNEDEDGKEPFEKVAPHVAISLYERLQKPQAEHLLATARCLQLGTPERFLEFLRPRFLEASPLPSSWPSQQSDEVPTTVTRRMSDARFAIEAIIEALSTVPLPPPPSSFSFSSRMQRRLGDENMDRSDSTTLSDHKESSTLLPLSLPRQQQQQLRKRWIDCFSVLLELILTMDASENILIPFTVRRLFYEVAMVPELWREALQFAMWRPTSRRSSFSSGHHVMGSSSRIPSFSSADVADRDEVNYSRNHREEDAFNRNLAVLRAVEQDTTPSLFFVPTKKNVQLHPVALQELLAQLVSGSLDPVPLEHTLLFPRKQALAMSPATMKSTTDKNEKEFESEKSEGPLVWDTRWCYALELFARQCTSPSGLRGMTDGLSSVVRACARPYPATHWRLALSLGRMCLTHHSAFSRPKETMHEVLLAALVALSKAPCSHSTRANGALHLIALWHAATGTGVSSSSSYANFPSSTTGNNSMPTATSSSISSSSSLSPSVLAALIRCLSLNTSPSSPMWRGPWGDALLLLDSLTQRYLPQLLRREEQQLFVPYGEAARKAAVTAEMCIDGNRKSTYSSTNRSSPSLLLRMDSSSVPVPNNEFVLALIQALASQTESGWTRALELCSDPLLWHASEREEDQVGSRNNNNNNEINCNAAATNNLCNVYSEDPSFHQSLNLLLNDQKKGHYYESKTVPIELQGVARLLVCAAACTDRRAWSTVDKCLHVLKNELQSRVASEWDAHHAVQRSLRDVQNTWTSLKREFETAEVQEQEDKEEKRKETSSTAQQKINSENIFHPSFIHALEARELQERRRKRILEEKLGGVPDIPEAYVAAESAIRRALRLRSSGSGGYNRRDPR